MTSLEIVLSWFDTHQSLLTWLGLLSVVMFAGSLVGVYLILIHLPQNYFVHMRFRNIIDPLANHPVLRIMYLILKNIVGVIFVLAGIAMLVLPGQGIISILLGLSFLSLPGKRRLVRRLILSPSVLSTINRMRSRAGKLPLRTP
jgi:archaellum biogenesis protein FlaJ (TadC family)